METYYFLIGTEINDDYINKGSKFILENSGDYFYTLSKVDILNPNDVKYLETMEIDGIKTSVLNIPLIHFLKLGGQ